MSACDMSYDWDELHAARCTIWTDIMPTLESCIKEGTCMAGLADCTKEDDVYA